MKKIYFSIFIIIALIIGLVYSCDKQKTTKEKLGDALVNLNSVQRRLDSLQVASQNYKNLSETEKSNLNRQVAELQTTIESLNAQIEELKTLNSELQGSIDDPQEIILGYRRSIDNLTTELNKANESNQTLVQEMANLKITYQKNSKDFIDALTNTVFTTYQKLIEINQMDAKLSSSIGSYANGERRLDLANEINDNLELLKQKIDESEKILANSSTTGLDTIVALVKVNEDLVRQLQEMKQRVIDRENMITQLITDRDRAYYMIKTKEELKELGLLKTDGSVLSYFKPLKLDVSAVGNEAYKITDKKATSMPLLHSISDIKVLTSHPQNSYTLVKESDNVTRLDIINTKTFWRSSNYLVIQTE